MTETFKTSNFGGIDYVWSNSGDMIGAPYEFDRRKQNKDFDMFNRYIRYADDSMMTIAIAYAIMTAGIDADEQIMKAQFAGSVQKRGREYPDAGYGGMLYQWLYTPDLSVV